MAILSIIFTQLKDQGTDFIVHGTEIKIFHDAYDMIFLCDETSMAGISPGTIKFLIQRIFESKKFCRGFIDDHGCRIRREIV